MPPSDCVVAILLNGDDVESAAARHCSRRRATGWLGAFLGWKLEGRKEHTAEQ